jgi:hypothetical protein
MTKYNIWTDLLHYGVVFGALLISWVPVMNATNNNIVTTSLIVGGIFVIVDKFAHTMILGEKN